MSGSDVLRAQLLAIRASADAALALLGPEERPPAPAAGPCLHPAHQRKPVPVGGDPGQFLCGICHSLVPGSEAP